MKNNLYSVNLIEHRPGKRSPTHLGYATEHIVSAHRIIKFTPRCGSGAMYLKVNSINEVNLSSGKITTYHVEPWLPRYKGNQISVFCPNQQ